MRRRNKKVLAAAVSTCLALGTVATPAVAVFAKGITIETKSSIALANGIYTVDVNILKETSDSASAAASYFTTKDLKFIVKDGHAVLQLRYSNPMIGGLAQIIDGVNETLPVYKEGTENYVELAWNELDEAVNLYMEINTGTIFGKMKQKARVVLDQSTLKKDEVAVSPSPEATAIPTQAPTQTPVVTTAPTAAPTTTPTAAPTQMPTTSPEEDQTMKDGLYETNVYLWHASNDQASMAASALNGTARISMKNGTGIIYLYTKQMSMGTITAYLQELKVMTASGTYQDAKVETKDADGNPTCFSFTLPHFEDYVTIKVNPHVALMGNQDIDARLKIDYTTVKEVKGDDLTEAPAETAAPSTQAPTTKPQATVKPQATEKPAVTASPMMETNNEIISEETITESSEVTDTTGSTTWNDAEELVSEEETEEESEETESEEEAEETESEEVEEMPLETGDAVEQETQSMETEAKNHTPLVATAAACASSFLTSLLWTIKLRITKR